MTPGAAADQATQQKMSKYASVTSTRTYCPIAIETAGTWNSRSVELVQGLGRHITLVTEDPRETKYLPAPLHCPSTGECGFLAQHIVI